MRPERAGTAHGGRERAAGGPTPERAAALIREWLLEDGYTLAASADPAARFRYAVRSPDGLLYAISQPRDRPRRVTLALRLELGDYLPALRALAREQRDEVYRSMRMELLRLGCRFGRIDESVEVIELQDYLHYDALAQSELAARLYLLLRGFVLLNILITREVDPHPDAGAT
jgi:hypothetical protein